MTYSHPSRSRLPEPLRRELRQSVRRLRLHRRVRRQEGLHQPGEGCPVSLTSAHDPKHLHSFRSNYPIRVTETIGQRRNQESLVLRQPREIEHVVEARMSSRITPRLSIQEEKPWHSGADIDPSLLVHLHYAIRRFIPVLVWPAIQNHDERRE